MKDIGERERFGGLLIVNGLSSLKRENAHSGHRKGRNEIVRREEEPRQRQKEEKEMKFLE